MKRLSLAIGVIATLLVFGGDALAAKPDWAGKGGKGGGSGEVDVPDYGDLIKLYRDADGVPYLTPAGENAEGVQTGLCQQPLPSSDCPVLCVETGVGGDNPPGVVVVDQTTCAIEIDCATCAQEVDFGRMNEVRSSDLVLASQLDDVVVKLATADCVSLDPAGRLTTSTGVYNGATLESVSTGTIDSPLQSLAIYKQLMTVGYLGDSAQASLLPEGVNIFDAAARALGTASDKAGEVNVDMVAYVNQLMGLTDPAIPRVLGKLCIDVREEVMGTVQLVEKCFLDYGNMPGNGPYDYGRQDNFGALPAPAYIPEVFGGEPEEGYFEHLGLLDETPGSETFEISRGPITDHVFGVNNPGFEGGNIGGFAQAADDTRAVIDYMHSWPLPAIYATPVPFCRDTPGESSYDVSISSESGLQVPVQMVATTEGREFTVSVANAGPSPASGLVTVIALTGADSGEVLVDGSPGPFVFEFTGLAAGASVSSTRLFTMGTPHVQTTINWTATVDAEDDVLTGNNSVTATTNVRVTGGSGSGGGGGNH